MKSFACPHCGEDVPKNRRSCPYCGSSESDGWGESETDVDDDEFDYDEYVERDLGVQRDPDAPLSDREIRAKRVHFVIWTIIASMVLAFFLPWLF